MKIVIQNRDERESHKGGDMVQVHEYVNNLIKLGDDAVYSPSWDMDFNGYDIVHLFHLNFGWTWKHYLNVRKQNKPYVITTVFYPFENSDMDISMMCEILDNAERVFCMSVNECNEMIQFLNHEVPQEKIVITNNGVAEYFTPEGPKYDKLTDYVMTAGRWEAGKGHGKVIDACRRLGLPVLAVGSYGDQEFKKGCQASYPEALCLEHVEPDVLATMYRGAKLYVCASNSERNNLCLMEAAACGCNLVSAPGNRGNEWYGPRLTIADPANNEALDLAIKLEYENPKEGFWIGKIPLWEEVTKQIREVYKNIYQEKYGQTIQ